MKKTIMLGVLFLVVVGILIVTLRQTYLTLQETKKAYSSLEQEHDTLQKSYSSLDAEHTGLLGRYEQLARENKSVIDNLEAQNREIQDTADRLEKENASLKARVAELEEEVASYYATGFTCTRSMLPTIDCGDEAVWKGSFKPEDITVGTIINFSDCDPSSGETVAHRVIEVNTEEREAQYLTKGDNTLQADPCWVPFSDIVGVLVVLRKGARPQDVVDAAPYDEALKRVRALEAEYEALLPQYTAAQHDYNQALAAYRAKNSEYVAEIVQRCGFAPQSDRVQTCSLAEQQFLEIEPLFKQTSKAWQDERAKAQLLNELGSQLRDLEDRIERGWVEVKTLECEVLDLCS